MKPMFVMSNGVLERELNKQPPKFVLAYDIKYENSKYNSTDFIGFEIAGFEFYFGFVENGPKPF